MSAEHKFQSLDEILADLHARLGGEEPASNVTPIRPEPVAAERVSLCERSIPKSYRWARPDSPELAARVRTADPAAMARTIAAETNVIILGAAGAGKTSLAVASLRALAAPYARFLHAYRLGTVRIQNAAGEGEAALVDLAMSAPLILLDDVGNERQTANNAVPDVIFERHAAELPTWYTTAFEPADIAKRYGDGVARRMFERALVVRLGAK